MRILHVLGVGLLLAGIVHAEPPADGTHDTSTPASHDVHTAHEVVVTATPMDAPLTVTSDLDQPRQPLPALDGGDYLKTIPGFSVTRMAGTAGDPLFRGLGGSRLNVQVDGSTFQGACSHRMDPPTAYVHPEAFDRLVVLKGPQSVRYGASVAGTVQFERRPPAFESLDVTGTGSGLLASFDRRDLIADAAVGSSAWYLRGLGGHSKSGNYDDGDQNVVFSHYNRWNAGITAGIRPDETSLVELIAEHSDAIAAYAGVHMDGVQFDRSSYGVRGEKRFETGWLRQIEAQANYHYTDHVMDDFTLRDRPAQFGTTYLLMNPDWRGWSERSEATFFFEPGTELVTGFDLRFTKHRSRNQQTAWPAPEPDVDDLPRNFDMRFIDVGVFGEATHAVFDAARIVAGARVDQLATKAGDIRDTLGAPLPGAHDERAETSTSGFLRYEHDVLPVLTAYAGVGHAQRPADYWERYSFSGFYLDREKITQLDVGLVYAGSAVQASLSAFVNRVDDFILTYNGNASLNVNAFLTGAEADLRWRIDEHWSVYGALAWVRGQDLEQDQPLPQIPPFEGRLGVDFVLGPFSAGVNGRLALEQDRVAVGYGNTTSIDLGRSAPFSVLSVNAAYRMPYGLLLAAGVDNVFDRAYAEHVSLSGAFTAPGFVQTERVNEPGRAVWIKLSAKLD